MTSGTDIMPKQGYGKQFVMMGVVLIVFAIVGAVEGRKDCQYLHDRGQSYDGDLRYASSGGLRRGPRCKITGTRRDSKCRNPENKPGGVWCYTSSSGNAWRYCNVPYCDVTDECPPGKARFGSHCYEINESKLTQKKAEKKCNAQFHGNGHLASIHSSTENDFIRNLAAERTKDPNANILIGLRNEEWSDDSARTDYTNWVTQDRSTGDCSTMVINPGNRHWRNAQWNNINCIRAQQYVCKGPTNCKSRDDRILGECPRNFVENGDNCYRLVTSAKTYTDAKKFCSNTPGGHVASIHSQEENDFILSLAKERTIDENKNILIGLFREDGTDGEQMDRWSDRSEVEYANWVSDRPNDNMEEKCAEMVINPANPTWVESQWNYVQCEKIVNDENVRRKHFVCKAPKPTLEQEQKYCATDNDVRIHGAAITESFKGMVVIDGDRRYVKEEGERVYEGLVALHYQGVWGSVCADGWDDNAAAVMCRSMGYPGGSTRRASFSKPSGRLGFHVESVTCNGDEESINECEIVRFDKRKSTVQCGSMQGSKSDTTTMANVFCDPIGNTVESSDIPIVNSVESSDLPAGNPVEDSGYDSGYTTDNTVNGSY